MVYGSTVEAPSISLYPKTMINKDYSLLVASFLMVRCWVTLLNETMSQHCDTLVLFCVNNL